MKQIKCTLPNASTAINGVKFDIVEDGVLSAPVEDAVAEQFTGIAGYEVIDVKKAPVKGAPATKAGDPSAATN